VVRNGRPRETSKRSPAYLGPSQPQGSPKGVYWLGNLLYRRKATKPDRLEFGLGLSRGFSRANVFSTILLSSGCQKKTAATNPNSQSKTELHQDTKPLQAADLVGYDGTKLRKSVDHIREANDKHNQEIERKVETGPDQ
jgi:hypothetical protein